jgi:hypothetical protein
MIGRRVQPSSQEMAKPKGFDDFDLRLGDLMRGERATLGKSLLDVQRELKIKATYVAAIENCDVAAFETPGFIPGYVRSYARFLQMDPDWAYRKFCGEAGFETAHGMSAAASSPRRAVPKISKKPVYSDPLANPNATFVPKGEAFFTGIQPGAIGSVLVLVALMGGLGYGGWSVLQEVQRVRLAPVDQSPGVMADLDPLAGAGRGADLSRERMAEAGGDDPVLIQPRPEAFDRIYRPQALAVPVLVARDGPIAAIDPGVGDIAPAINPDVPSVDVADNGAPVQVVEPQAPEVAVFAVRPAWVRIKSADGTVLLEKTLDAGERFVLPQTEAPALLRAGNSGSVFFAVNGETYGPAAPGAQVVSNVVLSPESLVADFALARIDSDPELARFVAIAEASAQ